METPIIKTNVGDIVEKQKIFAKNGVTKSLAFRKEQLQRLKTILKVNEEELYVAISLDMKKSKFETYLTELSVIYHEIDTALKNLDKWARPSRVKTDLANFPARSFIIREPFGTTLVIGAWNYPYQLVLAPAVAALAAGNTAILKPSELPGHASAALKKIINQNFSSEYLHVIEGGADVTTELLSHQYGKICFTGSTNVGRIVARAAAETLTPTLLELGGKSPCIVHSDADVATAAKRIAWGKFLNAGQTCIAPDYLLVHSSIYHRFLEQLREQASLAAGEVQIINDRNLQRLKKLIDPRKVFSGGNILEESRYIGPTILKDVSWDDECMQEEIFGPILPVLRFDHLDDVVSKINDRPKPLAAYVFSNKKENWSKVMNGISFGGGCVNDVVMHFTNNNLPFGGVGESGMGSYHGYSGFRSFTHEKAVLKKSLWMETRIKYAPHTGRKFSILKFIFG